MTATKKITLATVKSFINKNANSLYINVKSSFDEMTDCCESRNDGFGKAISETEMIENTMGVCGSWFVGSSRDYFNAFENETLTGIEVYNSCGHFVIAVQK